jgi:hypothetical protein
MERLVWLKYVLGKYILMGLFVAKGKGSVASSHLLMVEFFIYLRDWNLLA